MDSRGPSRNVSKNQVVWARCHFAGLASGIFNTSQQIGGAIGLAILSTISNNVTEGRIKDLGRVPNPIDGLQAAVDGFQVAMYAGAGFVLVAFLLHVLLIRRKDVASIDITAPIVHG